MSYTWQSGKEHIFSTEFEKSERLPCFFNESLSTKKLPVKEKPKTDNMNSLPSETTPPQVTLPELVLSLEQATLLAKQLPATTDPNHLLQIYSSLHQAHHNLSSFISQTQFPSFPPPPPPPHASDNSLSSATGAAADEGGDEPMQVGDDDYEAGAEGHSKAVIDKVEQKMRACFIKNKRPKRPLSPSSMAEERRFIDDRDATEIKGYDPHGTRMRALDLVYQFHG